MGDMDSGNSGSMQSSSTGGGGGGGGDDQEFESHGGDSSSTFPSFFNNNNNNNNPTVVNYQVAPFDNNARLLQLYSLNNGSSSLNIFDQHQQQGQVNFGSLESGSYNSNSNSHMENMMWANKFGPIRSSSDDHATNCTTTTNTTGGGYNNPQPHHQLGPPPPLPGGLSSENSPRSSNQNASVGGVSSGGGGGPGRNPKKRSRASRRAPTTVLTTDTSNFRQMVQEFTGIPAPPFSASGFPSRSRLDLFGGMGMGMGMGMSMGIGSGVGILPRTGGGGGGGSSNSMDPPSYLLRPFAQKILPHPSPPLNPQQPQEQRNSVTSTTTTNTSTNTNALTNATAAAASSSSGANAGTIQTAFHLSPQNHLQPPPANNPMLSFQSLLQQSSSSLIHDVGSGMDNLGSKGARSPGSLGMGSGESEPQNWAGLHQGLGLTQEAAHPSHQTSGPTDNHCERVGAINSTSDNHGGGVIRGERGMVDSWICSSD